jgi:hypothetical protein
MLVLPAFAFEIDRFFKWGRDHGEKLFLLRWGRMFPAGFEFRARRLRAPAALPPAWWLNLTKLFAIFLHKSDVFLR